MRFSYCIFDTSSAGRKGPLGREYQAAPPTSALHRPPWAEHYILLLSSVLCRTVAVGRAHFLSCCKLQHCVSLILFV